MYNILQCRSHDGLDGMHPVFGFVENDGSVAFKDFIGNFHAVDGEPVVDLLADGGLQVMEGRQAVHEAALITCIAHQIHGDPVGKYY